MQSTNAFQRTEDEYFRLKGQLAAGHITREQFEAALRGLMLQDAQGRWWIISVDSGKWFVYTGQAWVEANPYPMPSPPPALRCARCGNAIRPGKRSCSRCGAPAPSAMPPMPSPVLPRPSDVPERGALGYMPPPKPAAPPRKRISCIGCLLSVVAVLVLIVVLIALAPTIITSVQSFLPGLRPGDCKAVTPVVATESATGETLTCLFGIADALMIHALPSRDAVLKRIAAYTQAQKQALAASSQPEGFTDRSTWNADAAIYDVRATISEKPVFTKEGLMLYRDRYLIQVRLSNWMDENAMQTRWNSLLQGAKKLVDAKFK